MANNHVAPLKKIMLPILELMSYDRCTDIATHTEIVDEHGLLHLVKQPNRSTLVRDRKNLPRT